MTDQDTDGGPLPNWDDRECPACAEPLHRGLCPECGTTYDHPE